MSTQEAGPRRPASAVFAPQPVIEARRRRRSFRSAAASPYPHWFYLPAAIVFGIIFVIPTLLSFYYSMTRWTLFETEFIGLENFVQFFREPALTSGAAIRSSMPWSPVGSR